MAIADFDSQVHSSCHSFGGLIVVRLLLGAFEASSAPCLILITGMWYKVRVVPNPFVGIVLIVMASSSVPNNLCE